LFRGFINQTIIKGKLLWKIEAKRRSKVKALRSVLVLVIFILTFGIHLFSSSSIIQNSAEVKEEKSQSAVIKFSKNDKYLTPQVGINTWAIPFGVNFEYGLKKNIGIGVTTMMWTWGSEYWSNTLIDISAEAAYHFTEIKVDKLDLYVGGGLGFAIYSWHWKSGYEWLMEGGSGSSGIFLKPIVGARYYISEKIAIHLRLIGTVLNWAGFGSTLGVGFKL